MLVFLGVFSRSLVLQKTRSFPGYYMLTLTCNKVQSASVCGVVWVAERLNYLHEQITRTPLFCERSGLGFYVLAYSSKAIF